MLNLKSRLGRKCRGRLKEEGALTNRNNLLGPIEEKYITHILLSKLEKKKEKKKKNNNNNCQGAAFIFTKLISTVKTCSTKLTTWIGTRPSTLRDQGPNSLQERCEILEFPRIKRKKQFWVEAERAVNEPFLKAHLLPCFWRSQLHLWLQHFHVKSTVRKHGEAESD